jgi:hypothetical protein
MYNNKKLELFQFKRPFEKTNCKKRMEAHFIEGLEYRILLISRIHKMHGIAYINNSVFFAYIKRAHTLRMC